MQQFREKYIALNAVIFISQRSTIFQIEHKHVLIKSGRQISF